MWPGPASVASVMRQKPPLWSATHVRPFGSTSAPAEMWSPSPVSEAPTVPAAWAGAPVRASTAKAVPSVVPIRGSARSVLS